MIDTGSTLTRHRVTLCSCASSTVLITANNLYNLHHDNIESDNQLIGAMLYRLQELEIEAQREDIRLVRTLCTEVAHQAQRRRTETVFGNSWLAGRYDH